MPARIGHDGEDGVGALRPEHRPGLGEGGQPPGERDLDTAAEEDGADKVADNLAPCLDSFPAASSP
jgi:hypothetical protein